MAVHFWIFPWLALAAGLAALALGLLGSLPALRAKTSFPISRSLIFVWLFVTASAFALSFRLGEAAGVNVLAARGLLLGALGGAALSWCCLRLRGEPAFLPTVIFGLGTALVTGGRLWLTHGEITGLTSLALGAVLTVLCLTAAPSQEQVEEDTAPVPKGSAFPTLALLFVVFLTATVEIGFTKAGTLGETYWADIPLLLGAALALGTLATASLARKQTLPSSLLPIVAGLLIVLPLAWKVAVSWKLLGLFLLGVVIFALVAGLKATGPTSREPGRLDGIIGMTTIVVGVVVAFSLWSGYGLCLLIFGGWFACGPALLTRPTAERIEIAASLSFVTLLVLYRLALLGAHGSVRATGPGDIWDLFAISLGVLLPMLVSEWTLEITPGVRLAAWSIVLQWIVLLTLPALVLDYIWQPRSLAGVFLGIALGQMLANRERLAVRRLEAGALSSLAFSLLLLQYLPWLEHLNSPTRTVRIVLIFLLATVALLRVLFTGTARKRLAAPVAQEG